MAPLSTNSITAPQSKRPLAPKPRNTSQEDLFSFNLISMTIQKVKKRPISERRSLPHSKTKATSAPLMPSIVAQKPLITSPVKTIKPARTSKKKVGQRGKKSDKNDRKSDSSSKSENSDSESSNKSEEEEEEENGENERSKFDLYKVMKKLYEKQEKAAADLSKKQMGEVAKLKKLREVTKQEKVILDTFHNQIDERYKQEGDQCHQLHEQQLQELKLFEEMPNSVDLQHNDPNDI
ncbi:hypothetical protein M9Y10_036429 [Tritrichomonas musculus]|uniref:Uncharacterized protein n=1 Tax=Tritrichomonas musculus TaxID=1915356 RepID=A0ABR2GL32_9EUKA